MTEIAANVKVQFGPKGYSAKEEIYDEMKRLHDWFSVPRGNHHTDTLAAELVKTWGGQDGEQEDQEDSKHEEGEVHLP